MATEPGGELRIGNALKEARTRAGLDIRTVEDKTKIRTRYLRALESEEWDTLPGHAYVKGFLRTYANLLGLDADALVDEYRRTVEGPQASPVPLGEGVLQARRRVRESRAPSGGPSRGLIVGGLVVVIVAILLVLGLTASEDGGGGDEGKGKGDRKERKQGKGDKGKGRQAAKPEASPKRVELRFVTNTDGLPVCLLRNGKEPLIDGVAGSAGSEETATGESFDLRFPAGYDVGQFDLFLGGDKHKFAEVSDPQAFRITPPRTVESLENTSEDCP